MFLDTITRLDSAVSLPKDKIIDLIVLAQAGCIESRNKVVMSYSRMIRKNALVYCEKMKGVYTLDELFNEGVLGIIRAIELFNPEKASFTTYAGMWINAEISTYIVEKLNCVFVSKTTYLNNKKKGFDPISEVSLYTPVKTSNRGKDLQFIDILEDDKFSENLEDIEHTLVYDIIEKALTSWEKEFIKEHYGLYPYENATPLTVLSDKMKNTNPKKLALIKSKIVLKIKKYIEGLE